MARHPQIIPSVQSYDYVQASDPVDTEPAVETGETWYDTDAAESKVYDGDNWIKLTVDEFGELGGQIANGQIPDSEVAEAKLAFSTATQAELDDHDATPDAHHDRYTDEEVEDVVDALVAAGDKLAWTYDDAGDSLTIDTTALDEEEVEDAVDALLDPGNATTLTYDDGAGSLVIAVDESAISLANLGSRSHSDLSDAPVDAHHARYTDEEVEDVVAALLDAGGNLWWSYDDANDTLTLSTSALNEEEVEDAVGALVAGGNAISASYDDANGSLTIAVPAGSIGTDELGFDPATQGELDSHAGDTANPHNVTDDQTGAASALSNHASNSTAHHSKPNSTQSAGQSATWKTILSENTGIDFSVDSQVDQSYHLEVTAYTEYDNRDLEITVNYESGKSEVYTWDIATEQDVTVNIHHPVPLVSSYDISATDQDSYLTVKEIREYGGYIPSHSHSI